MVILWSNAFKTNSTMVIGLENKFIKSTHCTPKLTEYYMAIMSQYSWKK